ncbi:PTPLA-domain-containing protein [Rhizopus microsporus var. microsporus]|uniref:Very-long-chain (3R)-3-hydroxyacyl-CoA dehydratase n=2 Tax=Rhizopus microsporus TaxID=58291 RepID=A0A2G4T1A7_RHIZD|nr:protein tyrosine phosphatase [Rhizopus microsporus ATCC 52813]ORE09777.1 PTPLA-domain-containing protein [Rhizopus microsporus var. microsporus]PHZ14803.1 protein tyrosine phosphatase [Rhizopus microsporus ATCC 52813]
MSKGSTSSQPNERPPAPPGPKNFVEWYLLSYNQVSFLGWFWILYLTVSELYQKQGDYQGVFDLVWPSLSYVQTAALFEVLHSVLGFVRAPIMTTLMQVASRLFLVWGVNYFVPEIHTHWSFSTMVIAWSIAECTRYAFYIFHLSGGGVPGLISWARYNFFLVLYPLGVFSEMMMVYQALPYAKAIHPAYYFGLIAVALIYIPGFPVLFSHMLAQRRKYARGDLKKKQ